MLHNPVSDTIHHYLMLNEVMNNLLRGFMTTRIHKQIEFIGDYSKLKSMGFEFQKLFAGNYMQWSFETDKDVSYTRIWKKGAEVTVDDLGIYAGFFFDEIFRLKALKLPLVIDNTGAVRYVMDTVTKEVFFDEESISQVGEQTTKNLKAFIALEAAFPTPDEIKSSPRSSHAYTSWIAKQAALGEAAGLSKEIPVNPNRKDGLIDPKNLVTINLLHDLGWARTRETTVKL